MKYTVQEHSEVIKDFRVYEVALNGEICRRVALCTNEKDAYLIATMLGDQDAKVSK